MANLLPHQREQLAAMGLDPDKFEVRAAPVVPEQPTRDEPSALGSLGRAAKRAIVPTLTGIGAGALGGSWAGPWGMVAGGVAGGIGGAYGQEKVIEAVSSPEENAARAEQYQKDLEVHPGMTIAGELIPAALTMRPSVSGLRAAGSALLRPSTATAAQKAALATAGLGAGLGAVQETAVPLVMGQEIDPKRVVASTLFGATFNTPTALGRRLGLPGEAAPVKPQYDKPIGPQIQRGLLLPEVSDSTLLERAKQHRYPMERGSVLPEVSLSTLAERAAQHRPVYSRGNLLPEVSDSTLAQRAAQHNWTPKQLPARSSAAIEAGFPPPPLSPIAEAERLAMRLGKTESKLIADTAGPVIDVQADVAPAEAGATRGKANSLDILGRSVESAPMQLADPPPEIQSVPPVEDPLVAAATVAKENADAARLALEAEKVKPTGGTPEERVASLDASRVLATATAKAQNEIVERVQVGKSPQPYVVLERPVPTEIERANSEQPVRVRNEKTGEELTVLESDTKAIASKPQFQEDSSLMRKSMAEMSPKEMLAQSVESEPIQAMREHLKAARKAIADGMPISGELARSYEILPEIIKAKTAYAYDSKTDRFVPSKTRMKVSGKAWGMIAEIDAGDIVQKMGGAESPDIVATRRQASIELAKEMGFIPAFQDSSSLVDKPANNTPFQFKVVYQNADGTTGAHLSRTELAPGAETLNKEGQAVKVLRSVPYDRAYQMASEMPTRALLSAPENADILAAVQKIAERHNVDLQPDDQIRTPEGQLAAGVAWVKERLAKWNPSRAGIDTGLHEVAHIFLDDLRASQSNREQSLYRSGLDLFGGDSERLTEAVGLRASELVRNRIEGSLLGRFREWAKDFWSYIKVKWGSADMDDYKALLARRMVSAESPVSRVSDPEVTGPMFQKSSRAHELSKAVEKESILSNKLDTLFRAFRPVIDGIRAIGPEGKWLADNIIVPLYNTRDEFLGKYRNQVELLQNNLELNPSVKDLLSGRDNPSDLRIGKYLHEMRTEGRSSITLNDKETAAVNELRRMYSLSADDFTAAGGLISGRQMLKDPNYFPQMIAGHVADAISQDPNRPKARQYKRDLVEWLEKGGLQGPEKAWDKPAIEALWNEMIADKSGKTDADFGALQRAEGYGLPESWRDPSAFRTSTRYFDRYARKMAQLIHIEAGTDSAKAARRLLNMRDQSNAKNDIDSLLVDGQLLALEDRSGNADVKAFKADFFGDYTRSERRLDAANGLVKTLMLQTLTGIGDVVSSVSLAAEHMNLGDYFTLLPKAAAGIKDGILSGIRQNVVRLHANRQQTPFEGGVFQTQFSSLAESANRWADFINTITGRDGLEKFARGLLMEWGKLKMYSELGTKFSDPNHSSVWLDAWFGKGNWEKYKDTGISGVPQELIEKGAAEFVRSCQGKYDSRGLPAWALKGQIAPFAALARFNIEKLADFQKHVVTPARNGNFKPLLMLTGASVLTGSAIEQIREWLTGHKPNQPTWNEVFAAGGEGLPYKMMALAAYSGYAGILTDLAKQASDAVYGNRPQGFRFPVMEALAGGFDRVMDANTAILRGENIFDVATKLPLQLAKDNIQVARLIMRWSEEDMMKQEAYNAQRDLRVFRQLNGLPVPPMLDSKVNPFVNTAEKKFKRARTPEELAESLPGALDSAISKGKDDPEAIRRNLTNLKRGPQPAYPSLRERPMEASAYDDWLRRTAGHAAADEALQRYLAQQELQKLRASMVPDVR